MGGFFGVDRCFMGMTCLGVCKGLTLGGLGVWACIDWLVIFINMMQSADSISTLGFHANWTPGSEVETAFWIAFIAFVIKLCSGCSKIQKISSGVDGVVAAPLSSQLPHAAMPAVTNRFL